MLVFSLGMVIFEVMTLKKPYEEVRVFDITDKIIAYVTALLSLRGCQGVSTLASAAAFRLRCPRISRPPTRRSRPCIWRALARRYCYYPAFCVSSLPAEIKRCSLMIALMQMAPETA
jgi:hypothetical protein